MISCAHRTLVLLPGEKARLRCRQCHLTIRSDELGSGYCPECYEADGTKRFEFEEVAASASDSARYRCEECGVIIIYPEH